MNLTLPVYESGLAGRITPGLPASYCFLSPVAFISHIHFVLLSIIPNTMFFSQSPLRICTLSHFIILQPVPFSFLSLSFVCHPCLKFKCRVLAGSVVPLSRVDILYQIDYVNLHAKFGTTILYFISPRVAPCFALPPRSTRNK